MENAFEKPQTWDLNYAAAPAYAYDDYVCSGNICNSERYDGICRDSVYINLRVDTSNVRPVSVIHKVIRRAMSELEIRNSGLLDHVAKFVDLSYHTNYIVHSDQDYYGEEIRCSLTPYAKSAFVKALDTWDGWIAD